MSGHLSIQAKWTTICPVQSPTHRKDFPSKLFFWAVPKWGCSYSCPFSDSACKSWRIFCKPISSAFILSQLILGNSPWSHRCGWEKEGNVAGVGARASGLLPHEIYLWLQGLLKSNLIHTTSFDDAVLPLMIPSSWWDHSNLMTHSQVFSFY